MLKVQNLKKIFKKRVPTGSILKDLFFPQYQDFEALKGISFDVKQGEKVAFIGPNGAGKSTTIKAILGILHCEYGEIEMFGMNPSKQRVNVSRYVSSVFGQRSQLLYNLPLIDSFRYFGVIYDIPKDILEKKLNKFIDKFGIKDFITQPVRKLSLGQRMKGEIIASLLHSPKAIFLDEPTVGLDIVAKKMMYEVLLDIHKEENITIFLTSHDLKDIESLCDRTIIINSGEIIYDGMLDNLTQTYVNKKFIKYKERGMIDRESIEIENNPETIEKTIKYLFDKKNIEDVTIEDLPLEDIISGFYMNKIFENGK